MVAISQNNQYYATIQLPKLSPPIELETLSMTTQFSGGPNIAMKVPPHEFCSTVAFYEETLSLEKLPQSNDESAAFIFGNNTLWIDKVPSISQAEVWLQVLTNNTEGADASLKKADIVRCNTIETLQQGFDGFWISNPAGIVHLIDGT